MKNYLLKATLSLTLFIVTLLLGSCENEKVDLKNATTTENIINNESYLFKLLGRVTTDSQDPLVKIECIDFIYPFALIVYDSNLQPIETVSISGDNSFSNLLGTLNPNYSISISYPITTTLVNGDLIIINNNAELKIAIDNCSKEDIVSYCGGLFSNCVWEVPYHEGQDNQYASGYFTANPDGTIKFNYNNVTFNGTWIFLFIEDQFFLNIHLEGNSLVSQYWNKNHKIIFSDMQIEFLTPNSNLTLEKVCENQTEYTIGSNGPSGGIVFYDKGQYSNGWRYMEISTTDLTTSQWGCFGSDVFNSSGTDVGTGYFNSVSIANFHNSLTNYYLNPSLCNNANNGTVSTKNTLNAVFGGNNDWFLPSIDELNLVYTNLHLQNLGNFSSTSYWSSSQNDANTAKTIDFSNGNLSIQQKFEAQNKTRAIRYF